MTQAEYRPPGAGPGLSIEGAMEEASAPLNINKIELTVK